MNDRMCIVTRQSGSPCQMIRFVINYDHEVIPDLKGNLPGRGAWVTCQREVLEKAIKRKAFSNAFKCDIKVDESLLDLTDSLLKKSALGSLAMARKAGVYISGALKVQSALRAGQASLVLHAAEAKDDGKRKIAQANFARFKQGWDIVPVSLLFTGEELSLAFGDNHVIHAAVLKGVASEGVIKRIGKLHLYRQQPMCDTATAVKEAETE